MDFTIIIGNKAYSSWSLRGWLLAQRSGGRVTEHQLWLDTPEFPKQIKELSPSGLVPVLRHGDLSITDSLAIGEYLAELCPQARLWPENRKVRAFARSISCELHSGFAGIRQALPFNCRASGRQVALSTAVQKEIQRVLQIWSQCPMASGEGPWLFGHFTIADAMYAPFALRFRTYGIELPDYAQRYQQHCLADADIQRWISAAKRETAVIDHEEVGD